MIRLCCVSFLGLFFAALFGSQLMGVCLYFVSTHKILQKSDARIGRAAYAKLRGDIAQHANAYIDAWGTPPYRLGRLQRARDAREKRW